MPYIKEQIEYPSVTTIIGVLDKPALVGWAANKAIDYILEHRNDMDGAHFWDNARKAWRDAASKAADHGTAVHALAEEWIKGGTPLPDTDEHARAFEALQAWAERERLAFTEAETEVFSTAWGYAGKLDAIATDGMGRRVLVDFKTSSGIWPEYKVQVSAYKAAYEEQTGQRIDRLVIVRIDKETGQPEALDCTDGHEERIASFRKLVDYYYSAAARRLKNNPHAANRGIVRANVSPNTAADEALNLLDKAERQHKAARKQAPTADERAAVEAITTKPKTARKPRKGKTA